MPLQCSNNLEKLPESCLDGNGFLMASGVIFSVPSQEFADAATAGDDANWITDIKDGKLLPVHGIREIEDVSFVAEPYQSPAGDKIKTLRNKTGFKFKVNFTPDQHAAAKQWSGKKVNMYWYDQANNIMATTPDGTIVKAAKLGYLYVQDMPVVTDGTPAFTIIDIQFDNNSELNEAIYAINTSKGTAANRWYPYDLPVLAPVVITQVGTISANQVVFDVKSTSARYTDVDGEPISSAALTGLDVATFTNFTFTDGAGTTLTPNTMSESTTTPGRYTGDFTAISASATCEIIPTVTNTYCSEATTFS